MSELVHQYVVQMSAELRSSPVKLNVVKNIFLTLNKNNNLFLVVLHCHLVSLQRTGSDRGSSTFGSGLCLVLRPQNTCV